MVVQQRGLHRRAISVPIPPPPPPRPSTVPASTTLPCSSAWQAVTLNGRPVVVASAPSCIRTIHGA